MKTIIEYLINNHVNKAQLVKPTVENFIAWIFDAEKPFDFSIPMFTKILDKSGFAHLYSSQSKFVGSPFKSARDFIGFLSANKNEKMNLSEKQLEDGRFNITFSIEHDNTSNGYDGWNFYVTLDKSIKTHFDI